MKANYTDIHVSALETKKGADGTLTVDENAKFVPYWMIQEDTAFSCFSAYLD